MVQLPDENNTPFSLPNDVPKAMPVDYPALDSGVDLHEAYDEGLDDAVDSNPYLPDDNPVWISRRAMKANDKGLYKFSAARNGVKRWLAKIDNRSTLTKRKANK